MHRIRRRRASPDRREDFLRAHYSRNRSSLMLFLNLGSGARTACLGGPEKRDRQEVEDERESLNFEAGGDACKATGSKRQVPARGRK